MLRFSLVSKDMIKKILKQLRGSKTEDIRLSYTQIFLNQELPFMINIPNEVTKSAMHDADTDNTLHASSIDEIFDNL